MTQPSILFINRVYPPAHGATGRVLRDLARSFARQGWRVTIVCSGDETGRDRDGSVRVIRVKGSDRPAGVLGYLWVMLKMVFAALAQPKADIVVSMTDPPMLVLAGQMVAGVKRSRHMHWCQDLYPDLLPLVGRPLPEWLMGWLHKASRRAMARADKLIVIGRCMARVLVENGLDAQRITFIPNWPNFELCEPDGLRRKDAPAMPTAANERRFRVQYAGNLGRVHPVDVLLEAASILQASDPVVEFVFVGDGPRYEWLAQERSRRGLDNIRLMPYQPASALREVMESADVHLISMAEAARGLVVPCKVYSALAAHRPCVFVGPAHSEVAELLEDFGAGAVVQCGDAAGLAKQIRAYVRDGALWSVAYEGAKTASDIYVPKGSIEAFIARAGALLKDDV